MADEPTIREAHVDDARAIGTLHVRSWRAAYRGILPDALLDGLSMEEWIERRRKALIEPLWEGVRNWVVEEGGRIRGWAAMGPSRDEDLARGAQELMAIYLPPDDVGKGYGRRLMEHCIAAAIEQGSSEMTMWVLAGNERAQRFYAKAGFEADPRVSAEDFRDTGALKLRMWRTLP